MIIEVFKLDACIIGYQVYNIPIVFKDIQFSEHKVRNKFNKNVNIEFLKIQRNCRTYAQMQSSFSSSNSRRKYILLHLRFAS